jgi:single-strand DNA-binding protein
MLNHIVIMGRLTRDPELRRLDNGTAVTSFSIACERDFKNKNDEKETDFVDVVAYRNTAEFVSKFFTRGRMAVVSGRLQIRGWTDKEGNKRRSAEVVADQVYFADSKNEESSGGNYGGYNAPAYPATPASDFAMLDDDDAQLPF